MKPVKLSTPFLIIAIVILADQALKIWIKTHYPFGEVAKLGGFNWARLYFIENEGMAWGWKFGGSWGKMALTLFRLVAVIFGTWYLVRIVRERYSRGFIVCAALIYAGALGNLIDSMFYGLLFSASDYSTVASAFPPGGGYAGFLHGRVVDMLYFPFVENGTWPSWVPFVGGQGVTFFSPIFNIADAAISVGVITLIIFQKRFIHRQHAERTDNADGVKDLPANPEPDTQALTK
ncbi:lipoprotein signal peptidase [Flaviaesturariibacter aridisoli]|uniref:Lipoprotein signal peptidase n=1 Tax=Flaviaesturariibacter aridisoli TaxID=2545761 RepID=A0A4R4E7T6_9BACT|nr:lipoprotein signal peptidase [Flaviaesturariibacter aridisoli]TCZ74890.1 lipoprotein signal peptidase [Flaviaesturariibacter aridisoli]